MSSNANVKPEIAGPASPGPGEWIRQIKTLTFDCYGTLIDWETGIAQALLPVLESSEVHPGVETVLRLYVKHERKVQDQPWQPYRNVLQEVAIRIAQDLGCRLKDDERSVLARSIGLWPPFSDTISALKRLKTQYRLVIVSNIDDALFASSARVLEVPFDDTITAEQVRSYKPGEAHFREVLRRVNSPPNQVLHVAQSLYHDHIPAKRLGFRTAWVKRPSRLGRAGLAPDTDVQPDIEVHSLDELVDLLVK
jgi:2-haloacid dehalogenase